MLGWEFAIYRQTGGSDSPGDGESIKGGCVATWTAEPDGDEWLRELVRAGIATRYGDGYGHPRGGHSARAKDLRAQVGDAFADAHQEEWLLIDVWDLCS